MDDYAAPPPRPPVRTQRGITPAPGGMSTWFFTGLGAAAGLLVVGVLALLFVGRAPAAGSAAAPAGGAPVPGAATSVPEAAAEGARAPQFTLPDLSGKLVSLSDFRGRPVWINIWASWCGPCKAEMPYMKTLYAKYKGQGLVLLGVDFREEAPTIQGFTTQNGYDWTFLLDQDGAVSERYQATGIPVHAFVDRTGVIRAFQIGGLPEAVMETYLARILAQ